MQGEEVCMGKKDERFRETLKEEVSEAENVPNNPSEVPTAAEAVDTAQEARQPPAWQMGKGGSGKKLVSGDCEPQASPAAHREFQISLLPMTGNRKSARSGHRE